VGARSGRGQQISLHVCCLLNAVHPADIKVSWRLRPLRSELLRQMDQPWSQYISTALLLVQIEDDLESRYLRAQKRRFDFSLGVPQKGARPCPCDVTVSVEVSQPIAQ